jgi:hypothetical protein
MVRVWYFEMDARKEIDQVLKGLMKYSSFFEVFKVLDLLPTTS